MANLDPVVPVEVILDEGLSACGIQPALPLNAGHALVAACGCGRRKRRQPKLAAHDAAADAYSRWFQDTFGVAAGPSRAGFDRGTISLVGPVPGGEGPTWSRRRSLQPIAGAKIRTTQDAFFEIPGQVPEGEDFAARVKAIATAFAFGDLANLQQGADF